MARTVSPRHQTILKTSYNITRQVRLPNSFESNILLTQEPLFIKHNCTLEYLQGPVDATRISKMTVRDVAPCYITFESRVASYRYAQPITGRRTSTAGSKAPKSLKWPHKLLLPEQVRNPSSLLIDSPLTLHKAC